MAALPVVMLLMHTFLLTSLFSTAVGGSDGLTFRIPIKVQPHYTTTGYFDEDPSSSISMLLPLLQDDEQHGVKHENGTMLTAKNRWWRGGKKKKKECEKLPKYDVPGGMEIEIPLPEEEEETTGYEAAVPLHIGNVILGTISLGSQSFEVIFDTGSTRLWVFGKRVGKARKIEMGYEHHQRSGFNHRFYDEDQSDTLTLSPKPKVFECSYADGCVVSGRLGTENFKIGKDIVLKDMEFGITDKLSGSEPQSILYDGILGLGYSPTHVSPFARMTKQGLGKMYSVYISTDGMTGEVMLGGSNPELYKEPVYFFTVVASATRGVCSASNSKWCLLVEEIGFSSRRREDTATVFSFDHEDATQYPYAVVDTGSSHVFLRHDLAKKISAGSEVLRKAFFDPMHLNKVQCHDVQTLPTLRIKLGGGAQHLELTGPEYTYKLRRKEDGKMQCTLRIAPRKKGATQEFISIGAPFLRKYYTMFMGQGSGSTGKPHQIGFALSVHPPSK